jgi:hypothetical protein
MPISYYTEFLLSIVHYQDPDTARVAARLIMGFRRRPRPSTRVRQVQKAAGPSFTPTDSGGRCARSTWIGQRGLSPRFYSATVSLDNFHTSNDRRRLGLDERDEGAELMNLFSLAASFGSRSSFDQDVTLRLGKIGQPFLLDSAIDDAV